MSEVHPLSILQHTHLPGQAPQSMEAPFLKAWLGEKDFQQSVGPYDNVYRTHDHVNHLQIKRFLGHRVLTNMLNTDISIANLLPAQQVTPGLQVFEWTLEEAVPGIAPYVAEEAPPPQLSYATERRHKRLERRALMMRMTANILNTPEGIARVRSVLIMMMATFLRTFELETLRELLTAHDGPLYRQKINLDKFKTDSELEDLYGWAASRFGAWNRNMREEIGKDMAEAEKTLGKYVDPPYAVLYPASQDINMAGTQVEMGERIYVQTMDSQKQNLQFESLPSTLRLRNSLAFPVPDYQIGQTPTQQQPLLRNTMISEHYKMEGPPGDTLAYRTGTQLPGGGKTTDLRDVWLYDITVDQYRKVKFRDAMRLSGFVPASRDDPDDIDAYVGDDSPLSRGDFQSPNRKAPSRVYYENGPKKVRIFGQFDSNIVSSESHRGVGNTIAAAIYGSTDGPELNRDLDEGFQLIRELATAPFDAEFATALRNSLPEPTTYADAVPDLVAQYPGIGAVNVTPQTFEGLPATNITTLAGLLDEGINRIGTAPFLASFGGIQLLARINGAQNVTGRAAIMARQAAGLMRAANYIYQQLRPKFPRALALDPKYRPINVLAPNGFATFFSNVFLNNGNPPILYTDDDGNPVVTPFTWTQATLNAPDLGPFSVGSAAQPFQPGNQGLVISRQFAATAGARAFSRTTWAGQHLPLKQTQGRQSAGSLRRRHVIAGHGLGGAQGEEEDLFGARPSLRARGTPAGAPFGGVADEPGIIGDGGTLRGLRSGEGADRNPMYSENARKAWDFADALDDTLVRICTLTYVTAPCEEISDLERMMDSNILIPFDILLIRPACELAMYSVIVFKPGLITGMQAISDAVLDAGKNVHYQTRMVTYSLRFGTVILVPNHVVILPDRIARRYVSGGGVRLYESPSQVKDYESRPDLIPMVIPMGHELNRFEPAGGINVNGLFNGVSGSYRFPDAGLYEQRWGLSAQAIEAMQEGFSYEGEGNAVPDVSWTGEMLNWDRSVRIAAQGHRAGGSFPGCRGTWDGQKAMFPDYRPEKMFG